MIAKRYQLLDRLGSGGMGTVHRALDRLTGQSVALKRLTAPAIEVGDAERRYTADTMNLAEGSEDRLVLAREFRLLASLRHPNIISVLDYGFDENQRPYFAMEEVPEPRTLTSAGRGRPAERRVELLVEMLNALAYLHRRGVVHRDLKPSNVMVDRDRVKLLDFGISEAQDHTLSPTDSSVTGLAGTIPYLAPELFANAPADRRTDLWAVGIMAHELFAGRHPYHGSNLPQMMLRIVNERPELSTAEFSANLIPVIERLLAPDPEERYSDANEVIHDLVAAAGMPPPTERAAIRESFLQAARLVGRRGELRQLTERLNATREGRGGLLLVAGESGVGKSRLIDELRTLAMVDGAETLTGQAVAAGGSPYEVWREPLRRLCLLVNLTDAEAGVLDQVVPDLADLIGRAVEKAQATDPQAAQLRLLEVVAALVSRHHRPLVLILEDLHWAGAESLAMIRRLERAAVDVPLLIVGSYRDDERPELAAELGGAETMKLGRLGKAAIAELAESMLGAVGRDKEVLALLRRETEGNVLFLVEVVRALAEEAGRLDRVDGRHLPRHVTTGGIRRIIRRRLRRVPAEAREVLRSAAVFGRELDLEILARLHPAIDPTAWLTTCSNLAVLEAHGGGWRFAHDRLRENLLLDEPPGVRRVLHRRVAEAIEALYGDAAEKAAALAHHWLEAADVGDPEASRRAVETLEAAGRQALASCAHGGAEKSFTAALGWLETLPIDPETERRELGLRIALGASLLMSRGHAAPEVGKAFARALVLVEHLGDDEQTLPALLGLWRHQIVRGELLTARSVAERLVELAAGKDDAFQLLAEYTLGTNLLFQGEPGPALERYDRALELYRGLEPDANQKVAMSAFTFGQHPAVAALAYGAWAHWLLGRPRRADLQMGECRRLADDLGHLFSQAYARTLVAWLAQMRRDVEATAAAADEAQDFANEHGFPYFRAVSVALAGWARALAGEPAAGGAQIAAVLEQLRGGGSELVRPYFLSQLAEARAAGGEISDGLNALAEAEKVAERGGEAWWLPEVLRLGARLRRSLANPDLEATEEALQRAIAVARDGGARSLELRAALDLASFHDEVGSAGEVCEKARAGLAAIVTTFATADDSPELVAAQRLLGVDA